MKSHQRGHNKCVSPWVQLSGTQPNAAIRKQLEEGALCISALIYKCCTIKGKCRGWFAGDKLKCRVKIDQHWACLWFHPLFASNGRFLMTLPSLLSLYTIGEGADRKPNNTRAKRVEMIHLRERVGGWVAGLVSPSPSIGWSHAISNQDCSPFISIYMPKQFLTSEWIGPLSMCSHSYDQLGQSEPSWGTSPTDTSGATN